MTFTLAPPPRATSAPSAIPDWTADAVWAKYRKYFLDEGPVVPEYEQRDTPDNANIGDLHDYDSIRLRGAAHQVTTQLTD